MPEIKMGCDIKKMPQPFFCDQATPITRRSVENYFVGLLTHALRKDPQTVSAFPESSPVTGFRQRNDLSSTYSGGTVRDSHPIILFSSQGSSPQSATRRVIKLSKIL